MKRKILGLISGICCGIAASVPGVSWGTIVVVTGFHDTIYEALSLDFKAIRKNILLLLIFGAGLASGVFGFAHLVKLMVEKIPIVFYLTLSTLICLGLPTIMKKIGAEKKPTAMCIIPAMLGYLLVSTLFVMETLGVSGTDVPPGQFRLATCSAVAGFASIIPGISGSFVLVILGTYEKVITAIAGLDFSVLIFAGVGMALGLICGSRVITYFLKKSQQMVYSTVFGMIIASVLMLAANTIKNYA